MSDQSENIRALMMAVLDGESSEEEQRRLDELLAGDSTLREEWLELQRVKEVTTMMGINKPPDEVWDKYWGSVYAKLERGIAWILVSVGAVVLLSYGVWHVIQELMADASIPGFIKLAIAAVAIGGVILAVSVIREKWFVMKSDRYKDIQR